MSKKVEKEVKGLLEKYKRKLEQDLGDGKEEQEDKKKEEGPVFSNEYLDFRKEIMPAHLSLYEKACRISGKIMSVAPRKKSREGLEEALRTCHLDIKPEEAMGFSVAGPLLLMVIGLILAALPMFFGGAFSLFIFFMFLVLGAMLMLIFEKIPEFLANNWRLKASNQMVLCVFYVVTYMRHTSNLENAINFASEYLSPPLSLDFKKVLWDVETQKYDSIKESLDAYLQTWKKWNMEFIEAFHLIESSLYESSEERRLGLLDKSLDVMLEETYEKMLHYAHNLKSPITMLHMLGIILPILGLVILPLVVSFMGNVRWYYLAFLYNIILPVAVYFMGKQILSTRPTGYGDTDISDKIPTLKKYKKMRIALGKKEFWIDPIWAAMTLFIIFFIIGMLPLIMRMVDCNSDLIITKDYGLSIIRSPTPECDGVQDNANALFYFLEYKMSTPQKGDTSPPRLIGPYGLGASLLSVLLILGIGLSIGYYYRLRSQKIIKIRKQVKELEQEFASGLFQLGNRLGDGLPAEIAFSKVADVMEGTNTGDFFRTITVNISSLGMGVKDAIFDPVHGAIVKYPSAIISSSMKVLIQSVKKGPKIAAQAMMNVSRYIKEIHRVDERLKDLMSDIISSMKSQISFLTPAISGIVIGITSMVITIIGKLGSAAGTILEQGDVSSTGVAGADVVKSMFSEGIPTYYFQIVVGLYVIQIVYILTVLSNGIENGSDKLNEKYLLGVNMFRSPLLYGIIAIVIMFAFNFIAVTIVKGAFA